MIEVALPPGIRSLDPVPPRVLRWVVSSGWAPFQQTGDLGTLAEGWRVHCQIAPGDPNHGRLWRAFLARMKGPTNYFLLDVVKGAQTGRPGDALVAGSGQLGGALSCDGAPPDVTVALAGDVISVGGRGYVLLADANSNGAGEVNFQVEPPIVKAPADNAPVLIRVPLVRFRLPDNQAGGWNLQPGRIETPTGFDAVEVLP